MPSSCRKAALYCTDTVSVVAAVTLEFAAAVPVTVTVYDPFATSAEVVPPPLLLFMPVPAVVLQPEANPSISTSATHPSIVHAFERAAARTRPNPKSSTLASAIAPAGSILPLAPGFSSDAFAAPPVRAKLCTPVPEQALCDVYTVSVVVADAPLTVALLME